MERIRVAQSSRMQRRKRGIRSWLYIDAQGLVWSDEGYRVLRVRFVGLDAIGEPHGDEAHLQALATELLGRQLAQPAGHCGINAAADTEHQGLRCGGSNVPCDKSSATGDFSSRIEMA
ncbi:hypothetical protein D9M73_146250 [compost metagenome]